MTFPRIRFTHCLSWLYSENSLLFGLSVLPFRNPKIGKGATIQIDVYKYCFQFIILIDYKKYDAFMEWRSGGYRKGKTYKDL